MPRAFVPTHATAHPPYQHIAVAYFFKAMGKPAWLTKQKLIVQALINLNYDNIYIEIKTYIP